MRRKIRAQRSEYMNKILALMAVGLLLSACETGPKIRANTAPERQSAVLQDLHLPVAARHRPRRCRDAAQWLLQGSHASRDGRARLPVRRKWRRRSAGEFRCECAKTRPTCAARNVSMGYGYGGYYGYRGGMYGGYGALPRWKPCTTRWARPTSTWSIPARAACLGRPRGRQVDRQGHEGSTRRRQPGSDRNLQTVLRGNAGGAAPATGTSS